MATLGLEEVGYRVAGDKVQQSLRVILGQYGDSLKQVPPIPTRIYTHILSTLRQKLEDFNAVLDRFLDLTRKCYADPRLGRSKGLQNGKGKELGEAYMFTMPELLNEYGLKEYFHSNDISADVKGISNWLHTMQTVARLAIHAYSGMRNEEVSALTCDCLETSKKNGRLHYIINGITSKLTGGTPKKASWVTGNVGASAIEIAQKIASIVHAVVVGDAEEAISPGAAPLMPAISHLGFGGRLPKSDGNGLVTSVLGLSEMPRLRSSLQPLITEADLLELEHIDPHRAWRTEENFVVGTPWKLTSHQLRRSLALYAQRSGLVSLPSLRRQLQHITEEMSRYYARGSVFAENFIGDYKAHFGREWQSTQPASAALSYIKNVLLGDEVLFGAHGNWIEHRLKDNDGVVVFNRERTMRRFKKGELAYRETSIGGCTSTEKCDKLPLSWLNVECVNGCKNLVGRLPKLERVIVAQSNLVDALDPTSPGYRMEKADLEVLVSARDKVVKREFARNHRKRGGEGEMRD
ncbi:integrase [Paraburkholderia phytofirmans]|uniref:integrase n=1 Tax=Paraburkholderia phytofirmans TaxID=261302 RepID=UPI0011E03EE4|nr:integrase [Paraburkholderia phytofirmans]